MNKGDNIRETLGVIDLCHEFRLIGNAAAEKEDEFDSGSLPR